MDRGAWQALVHGAAKTWTGLSTSTKFINVFSPSRFLFPGPIHSQSNAEWMLSGAVRPLHILTSSLTSGYSNVHVRLYPEGFCVCCLQGIYF